MAEYIQQSYGFTQDKRGTLKYTFAHWCAFQMVALNLGVWKFRHLLHDIDKPFLMWWYRNDYKKVQLRHRTSKRHHIENVIGLYSMFSSDPKFVDACLEEQEFVDWESMVIDWECSRYTKLGKPETARQTAERMISELEEEGKLSGESINKIEYYLYNTLDRLGL